MSRTDSHRPPWVHIRDGNAEAFHRHELGPCDLPPLDEADTRSWAWAKTRCYWAAAEWEGMFGRSKPEQRDARQDRRKARRKAPRQIREQLDSMRVPDHCECPCHHGPDACAICTNDYADLCEREEP